jgi:hypothetical protein
MERESIAGPAPQADNDQPPDQGELPMESEWITMFRQVRQQYGVECPAETRATPQALPPETSADRRMIDTYRAVLRALFGAQSLTTRRLDKPFLFLVYSDAGRDPQPVLTEEVRRGITHGSDNLPVRIEWIEELKGAGRDRQGEYIPSGGTVLRFTETRRLQTDAVLVKGRIHRWGLDPREFELVVERRGGFWMVTNP